MSLTLTSQVLDDLKSSARADAGVQGAFETLADRLESDDLFRAELADEMRNLLRSTNSTHVLTEIGILASDTISAGFLNHMGRLFAPSPPDANSMEAALRDVIGPRDALLLRELSNELLGRMITSMWQEHEDWKNPQQMASAVVILATRVAGAGLDARLTQRMPELESWNSPFIRLSRTADRFATQLADTDDHEEAGHEALSAVSDCLAQMRQLRAEKRKIGTTLHLSSESLRIVQQLERLQLLISATLPQHREEAIAELFKALFAGLTQRFPTLHFLNQKVELLAYLIIGHAAQQGGKYSVDKPSEFWSFGRKSLFGGAIVAVFAVLKIHLAHEGLAPIPQAMLYGLNYAMAFVLIYVLGATLATKQPALTASRIAKSLEEGPEVEPFAELVRSIFMSQFISFIGNIVGAASFGLLLAIGFQWLVGTPLVSPDEAAILAKKINPLASGTIFYAALAGVMLSTAGFMAGFIDNLVVFHRLDLRVEAGSGLFRLVPPAFRLPASKMVTKHTGGISGNMILGIMLGSTGSIGLILGLPLDIRHIAFASTHGALSIFAAPQMITLGLVLLTVFSVCLIGLINFLVSFGFTLSVAMYARDLDGVDWREQLNNVWRLLLSEPMSFLIPPRDPKIRPEA